MAIQNRLLQTCVVNFICQKVQNFWADSDSLGKINDKKIFKKFFFQCLALPKDPQSFCPYVVKAKKKYLQNFSKKKFYYTQSMQGFHTKFFFKKIQLEVGETVIDFFFILWGTTGKQNFCACLLLSTKGIFVTAIIPTSNWNFLKNFAFLEHLDNSYGIKKKFEKI